MIFIGLVMFSTLTFASNERARDQDLPCEFMQSTHGSDCTTVVGPNYVQPEQIQLDIVFVIDSTGSMHDEIRTVKEELVNIVDRVNSGYPSPDVRVGVVAYRDYNDEEYLTRDKQLTHNTNSVTKFIRDLNAYGGGDYEEAVEAGLDEAINHMNWRNQAHKIIILVGDAPARDYPSQNYYGNEPEQDYHKYNWKDAVDDADDRGIRIYTASGSGMNGNGIEQWKTIARKTGGSYIDLIYERRIIEDHYTERGISQEYVASARGSRDYEPQTDSVMTNNFGLFAEKSVMQVAESAGVEYDRSLEDITGELTRNSTNTKIKSFFEEIIFKLKFWK